MEIQIILSCPSTSNSSKLFKFQENSTPLVFITVIIKIIDIEIDEKPVFLLLIKKITIVEVKYFSQVKMDHSMSLSHTYEHENCAVMKLSLLKVYKHH